MHKNINEKQKDIENMTGIMYNYIIQFAKKCLKT